MALPRAAAMGKWGQKRGWGVCRGNREKEAEMSVLGDTGTVSALEDCTKMEQERVWPREADLFCVLLAHLRTGGTRLQVGVTEETEREKQAVGDQRERKTAEAGGVDHSNIHIPPLSYRSPAVYSLVKASPQNRFILHPPGFAELKPQPAPGWLRAGRRGAGRRVLPPGPAPRAQTEGRGTSGGRKVGWRSRPPASAARGGDGPHCHSAWGRVRGELRAGQAA